MSAASITMSLKMEGAGWASVGFALGDQSYLMNGVSHIFDPMDDLLRAAAIAATAPAETHVRFFGEPMEWRLWLSTVNESEPDLAVEIGTFPDFNRKLGESRGDTVLSGICDRRRFARTVLNAFWPWSTREVEYQELWYEPFPTNGFALLQAAVSS